MCSHYLNLHVYTCYLGVIRCIIRTKSQSVLIVGSLFWLRFVTDSHGNYYFHWMDSGSDQSHLEGQGNPTWTWGHGNQKLSYAPSTWLLWEAWIWKEFCELKLPSHVAIIMDISAGNLTGISLNTNVLLCKSSTIAKSMFYRCLASCLWVINLWVILNKQQLCWRLHCLSRK
jgi:hypothetical protein